MLLSRPTTQDAMTLKCPDLPTCRCNKELTSVDCTYGQLTVIPKFPSAVLELRLDYNNLTSIPSRAFRGLYSLTSLYLNYNQIRYIAPFAFEGLVNLTKLELQRNIIDVIQNKSFADIPRLQVLHLNRNKIICVVESAFNGTSSIVTLDLSVNNLAAVPAVGYQPNLRNLYLSSNLIVNATFPRSYRNGTNELSINLVANKITELRSTFTSLDGATVSKLKLSQNNITLIHTDTFEGLTEIKYLTLYGNPVSKASLKNISIAVAGKSLISLDLSAVTNKIHNSISVLGNSSIKTLKLARNSIAYIADYTFVTFSHLTWLYLDKNRISEFGENAFTGLNNLLGLRLSQNKFEHFPKYLPASLQTLILSRNQIGAIRESEINYLHFLRTLVVKDNDIRELNGDFRSLNGLRVLDLSQNHIQVISLKQFRHLNNLTKLYLSYNDIHTIELGKKLVHSLISLRDLDLANNNLDCVLENTFRSMKALKSLHLDGNNLNCVFNAEKAVQLFTGLNNLEELSIASNNIQKLPETIFPDNMSLKILKMDHNKFSGWTPTVFKNIKHLTSLDVSHNLITVLDKNNLNGLSNLEALKLEGNPFSCNCDLLWFREWMDRTTVRLPKKETFTCHGPDEWRGKPVLDFTSDKINCPTFPALEVIASVSATLIVSTLLVIFIYKNRWRLRLRLYLLSKRGQSFLSKLRANDPAVNYGSINNDQDVYDAYISCSEYDDPWVLRYLLPDIDNGLRPDNDTRFGGDFKLYFEKRDFDPGVNNVANIFEHMTKSRKVIVVLSRDYYNGTTGFELDQATTLYHDHDIEDIIVIKVGDVPARRIPPHLYSQMRNGNFIEWEDDENAIQTFREKLKERLRNTQDHAELC